MRKKSDQVWVLSNSCFCLCFWFLLSVFSAWVSWIIDMSTLCMLAFFTTAHLSSVLVKVNLAVTQPKEVNSIAGIITFTICSIDFHRWSAVSIMALWSTFKYIYNVNSAKQKHSFGVVSFPGYVCLNTTSNQNCRLGRPGSTATLGSSNMKFPFIIYSTADFVPMIYRSQQEGARLNPCELQTCMTCML